MKKPFRKIVFVYDRYGGGATMGCYQPSYAAREELGYESEVLDYKSFTHSFSNYEDSLILFFKKQPSTKFCEQLKERRNTLIYYVGDMTSMSLSSFLSFNTLSIDGVIVGSKKFKEVIEKRFININISVIPANHDLFLEREAAKKHTDFSLYFGGSPDSRGLLCQGDLGLKSEWNFTSGYFHPLRRMIEVTSNSSAQNRLEYFEKIAIKRKCQDLESQISSVTSPLNFSCHYAVRSPLTIYKKSKDSKLTEKYDQWFTKTGGKVSTAAACNSNIITSLDPSVRELIDESYPYAIDTEKEEFLENWQEICEEMYKKAKSDFNSSEWKRGLRIMKEVKERTKTSRIVSDYIDFGKKIREGL